MSLTSTQQSFGLWPLLVYAVLVLLVVGGMIILSYFLGQKHKEPQTDTIFESGVKATGDARIRFPVQFYIVAMFFVIFDVESIFIFSWAVASRQVGWSGYISVLIFIVVLVFALIYLWRVGALDWVSKVNYSKSKNVI